MYKHIMWSGLAFLLIVAGCGANSGNTNTEESAEKDWEVGSGDLSDSVTTGNVVAQPILPPPSEAGDQLLENTTYQLPSGKWFLHNGDGVLGFSMPAGTMHPGDQWSIDLIAHERDAVNVNKDVRIKLDEVGEEFETQEVILDETIYLETVEGTHTIMHGRVPTERDSSYVFSVQVLRENGLVEDTLVSYIHVPVKEVNAALTIDQTNFSTSADEAHIKMENDGPTVISLGKYYQIEKRVDETWRVVPLERSFNDIGIAVEPRGNYEQTVPIDDLPPGTYRVVKTIWIDGFEEECDLAVEFEIT
ncbi:hypothetical protein JNUCC1_02187 [Lentibacillus sp. JNUCC-1]|uniref:immunoglobulin-like domain-containing protein n=1 Tax=Lentibacillus sp. JNUCC-1 TaxID=2654513 RepID=UPI0012E8F11C|nr:immunoglobulin-like domain-containing protein [Lentibacillus sp. JNUCC-1]MUV38349.1 hypothetical protein [Lentibacillus sp. JNUCC-1]